MTAKNLLKYGLTHLLILTFILLLAFSDKEQGDMNVVIFGTFIYLPYVLILTAINLAFVFIGLHFLKTNPLKWVTAFLSTALLTVWYAIKTEQIEIHFWKINQIEFISLNIILCVLNLATVYLLTKNTKYARLFRTTYPSMTDFQKIINIIKTVRNKITDDCDVNWTNYDSVKELQTELDSELVQLEKGDLEMLDKFKYRFLPTATFQEISLSNGWGDEFIELANKFDELYEKIKSK